MTQNIKRLRKVENAFIEGLLIMAALVSGYMIFYAYDPNATCYGQVIVGVADDKALQITQFEVSGMDNVNISWRFQAWFEITMVLAVLLSAIKGFSLMTVYQNMHPCYSCA